MRPLIARVRGESMQPSYNDGDVCLALPLPRFLLGSGSVALFEHPAYGLMIKRVAESTPDGVLVQGDNPRHDVGPSLGTIAWQDIRGRVVWRVSRGR